MVCIFQKKLVARGMSIPDSRVESIIFAILVDLRYNVLWNYFESLALSLSVDEYMLLYQQTHILQSDKNKSVKRKSVHSSLKHQINVQRNVLWATLTKLFKNEYFLKTLIGSFKKPKNKDQGVLYLTLHENVARL